MTRNSPPQRVPFACVSAAWKAHEGEPWGYLRHRVADPDIADALLQDLFVKAMRQCLRDRLTLLCQVRFEPDGSVCGHAGRAAPWPARRARRPAPVGI